MMRHRFHSICPYFAMFPEEFVQKHLVWSQPGDLVLDPFCGRGTTVFEALLRARDGIGCDTNPVAVCVSRAKADPPRLEKVLDRLAELEELPLAAPRAPRPSEFFRMCFHRDTYRQIDLLRRELRWKRRRDDCFIAAMALGLLHGESHRTALCFSNRMPRTISTKPAYSVRWWRAHGYQPPRRDVFAIMREVAVYRYASDLPGRRGHIAMCDAREASARLAEYRGRVRLVVTSPPYLDTTNYREDQWLRLWFLGGEPRPEICSSNDDRHRGPATYWPFLEQAWRGISALLADGAHIIIRIGGRRVERDECQAQLSESLREGLGTRVRMIDRRSSQIRNRQAIAFHPRPLKVAVEHDFHFRVG